MSREINSEPNWSREIKTKPKGPKYRLVKETDILNNHTNYIILKHHRFLLFNVEWDSTWCPPGYHSIYFSELELDKAKLITEKLNNGEKLYTIENIE